jgi:hypothetical protein
MGRGHRTLEAYLDNAKEGQRKMKNGFPLSILFKTALLRSVLTEHSPLTLMVDVGVLNSSGHSFKYDLH